MKKLIDLFFKYKEVILYLFFGGCSTLVNIVTYGIGTRVLEWDVVSANILAWVCSVIFAYLTNKFFVFESKTNDLNTLFKEVLSFFSARIVTLLLDVAIMKFGIYFGINDLIMKVIANIFVIIANYIFSKLFIFKKEK